MERTLKQNSSLWLLGLCLLAFWAAYVSPVSYSGDSRLTLLTSQALLENRSARLESYFPPGYATPMFTNVEGHLYNYFPVGTSLYALPFVWMARLRGMDMARPGDNLQLENLLSALLVGITPALIFLLCRAYLDYSLSFLCTIAFVFGSAITSSMAVMLWSIDLSMVLVLLSLLLLVRDAQAQEAGGADRSGVAKPNNPSGFLYRQWLAFALGWLLFSAYLVRPSTQIFILVTLVYLLIRRRPLFLPTAIVPAAGLAAFMIYSRLELGKFLPYYYSPSRLGNPEFFNALAANLISPGRGLLVYCPFLLITLFGSVLFFRQLYRRPFFIFGLTWFLLQYLSAANFPHWWGGWSYGPRLLADALPAALLLTLEVFNVIQASGSTLTRRLASATFALLTLTAIFINTYQGLFNPSTLAWNNSPAIDQYPAYIWDWRYPPFLASPRSLQLRLREHLLPGLPEYTLGEAIAPNSQSAIFENWEEPYRDESEKLVRWTKDRLARVIFKTGSLPNGQNNLALKLQAQCLYEMQVVVRLNGANLGKLQCSPEAFEKTLRFPASGLRSEAANIVEFDISEAAVQLNLPGGRANPQMLGLQLQSLRIAPVGP